MFGGQGLPGEEPENVLRECGCTKDVNLNLMLKAVGNHWERGGKWLPENLTLTKPDVD